MHLAVVKGRRELSKGFLPRADSNDSSSVKELKVNDAKGNSAIRQRLQVGSILERIKSRMSQRPAQEFKTGEINA